MIPKEWEHPDIAAANNSSVKDAQYKPLSDDTYSSKNYDVMTLSEISETINSMRHRIRAVNNPIKQKQKLLMMRIQNPQYMEEMSREIIEEMLRQSVISKHSCRDVMTEKYEHEQDIVHDFERGITKKEGRWLCSFLFWQTMYRLQQRRLVVAEMVVTLKRLQRKFAELKRQEGNKKDPKSQKFV